MEMHRIKNLKSKGSEKVSENTYKFRKQNGICVLCGKVTCLICGEKQKISARETRKHYKQNRICYRCRVNKLFGDENICLECLAKLEIYNKKYKANKKNKCESAERLKDKGICVACRKNECLENRVYCKACLVKHRLKATEYRRKKDNYAIPRTERASYGLCYFCGEPVKKDYRVCEKHYQMCLRNGTTENANKARKVLQEEKILY